MFAKLAAKYVHPDHPKAKIAPVVLALVLVALHAINRNVIRGAKNIIIMMKVSIFLAELVVYVTLDNTPMDIDFLIRRQVDN